MYRIEGHEYVRARNANTVALYLGRDVVAPSGLVSPADVASACDRLAVGEALTLQRAGWATMRGAGIGALRVIREAA